MIKFLRVQKILIFFILIISIIVGCSNNTIQEKDNQQPETKIKIMDDDTVSRNKEMIEIEPYNFSYQEQEFEIIPLYIELLEYIAQARETPKTNWRAIYEETVEDVFQHKAWGYLKTLYGDPSFKMFEPSYDLNKLEESVYSLIEQNEHINHLISEALKKSADLLQNKKTRVFIIPSNPEYYQGMESVYGVTGYTFDTQNFVIQVEPSIFDEGILQYIVAHEYHHLTYIATLHKHSRTNDYIHYLLMEGRADSFAHIIYPDVLHPGIMPLESEQYVWENMKKTMDPNFPIYIDFMKGNRAMNIPPLSNYKIGFQIMQDFIMHNPDVTVEEWTNMPAIDIFELSRFEERFQD